MSGPGPEVEAVVATAVEAARAAGAILRARAAAGFAVLAKGVADIVTEVDLECERAIVALLRARHPRHEVLAEEGTAGPANGASAAGRTGWLWIIDPLDGTKNFAHGQTRSAVSIAVAREGEVVAGVVHNPHTDELFVATRGGGAACNGQPIRVSATARLARAMVGSALTYQRVDPGPEGGERATVRRADREQLERLARVLAVAEAVRSSGCCALDLCDVARGRLDGFFEPGLAAWDTAAGALLVTEAGGRVSSLEGAPHDLFGASTLASNGRIHDELLALVPPWGQPPPRC